MPRPRVTSQMTTSQVARQLDMGLDQMVNWIARGVLPPPSFIDNNGVRYFDHGRLCFPLLDGEGCSTSGGCH